MRMTDYNKHQLSHPDMGPNMNNAMNNVNVNTMGTVINTVGRHRDTLDGGWRSSKLGKKTRRRYSESEEYDSDTDSERQECIFCPF